MPESTATNAVSYTTQRDMILDHLNPHPGRHGSPTKHLLLCRCTCGFSLSHTAPLIGRGLAAAERAQDREIGAMKLPPGEYYIVNAPVVR